MAKNVIDRAETGWYLYSNGVTRWGVGVWDGGKYFPKLISAQDNELPLEDKMKIWENYEKEMDSKKKVEDKREEEKS